MRPACQRAIVLPSCVSLFHDYVKVSLVSPSSIAECQMRDKMEFRDAGLRLSNHDDAYRPNGVIESLDYRIFNVFMRVSVSALRVGGYRGGEEGLRSGNDPRSLHRLSCLSGHNPRLARQRRFHAPSLSHATTPGWLSLPLDPLNKLTRSLWRSEADSWMCRSGMSRYSVRASWLKGGVLRWGRRPPI